MVQIWEQGNFASVNGSLYLSDLKAGTSLVYEQEFNLWAWNFASIQAATTKRWKRKRSKELRLLSCEMVSYQLYLEAVASGLMAEGQDGCPQKN